MEDLCCNCSKKTWTTNKNSNEFDLSSNNIIKKEENNIVDKNNNIENKEQDKDVIKDNIKENKENSIKENNEKNDKQDAIGQCLEKLTNLMTMMVEQKKNEENHENSIKENIKENNEENNENNIEDNVKNDNKDIKLQQQPDNIKKLEDDLLILQYRYYKLYQQFTELEEEEEEERYANYPKERRKNKKNIIKNNLKTNTIISTTNNNMLDEKNTSNIFFNDLLKKDANDKLKEIKDKIMDFNENKDEREKKISYLKKEVYNNNEEEEKVQEKENAGENNNNIINNNISTNVDNQNNINNNKNKTVNINDNSLSLDGNSVNKEDKRELFKEQIEEYRSQIRLLDTYISAKKKEQQRKKQQNRERQKNKNKNKSSTINVCLEQIVRIFTTINDRELAYRVANKKNGKTTQSQFYNDIKPEIQTFLEKIYGKNSDRAANILASLERENGSEDIKEKMLCGQKALQNLSEFFPSLIELINHLYTIAKKNVNKKDANELQQYKQQLCEICKNVASELKDKQIFTWDSKDQPEEPLIPKNADWLHFLKCDDKSSKKNTYSSRNAEEINNNMDNSITSLRYKKDHINFDSESGE